MSSVEVGIFVLPMFRTKIQCLVQNGSSVHVAEQFHYLVILVLNPWHSARDLELPSTCLLNEQMIPWATTALVYYQNIFLK